jgi:hypothetical protein
VSLNGRRPRSAHDADRAALEHEAEEARARLWATLDALDQRRHDAFGVRRQVSKHWVPIVTVSAIVLVVGGGTIAFRLASVIEARRHRVRARVRAIGRWWRHPQRTARHARRSSAAEIARRVLLAAVSMLAVEATKRFVRDAVRRAYRAGALSASVWLVWAR